ncbi:amino acid adenylation domain-containing protein, partial [Paenibacillus lentus]|uniref:non-ribosomal peptide synthetase n=1 Tax=Paenibacillus lentus TaxID=1338368 RepID=UPI0036636976
LQEQGVGPGTFVGLMMDRSFDMVVGVIGILKAGGAYIPVEPAFPDARLEHIFTSMQVPYVLTKSAYAARLDALQQAQGGLARPICMDNREMLSGYPAINPQVPGRSAEQTAYAIFTSGSTGVPKGVIVKHQPVVNLLEWAEQTFAFGPEDRVLFITSLCFDLSVFDIFGLLSTGGSIQLVGEDDIRNPERLIDLLCEEPVTFWDSAPAALQQLAPQLTEARLAGRSSRLRLVFLSGDWIPLTLPKLLQETFPGVEVIGLGGATEATVWSNYYRIGKVQPDWASIPYGKPIQNAHYYVLDAEGHVCPAGIPGELHIGGECLASGYNDPELTASKFIPNPFHPGRMYRTGDLARWMDDGNIEFLGRLDYQVKIRGYRVELGEIQAVLYRHPDVKDTVIIDHTDESGQKYLCAYVVSDKELTAAELREYMAKELPGYMIPSAFVQLAAMPVTANGKLDRKALPEPNHRMATGSEYVAPRNEREERLAAIWRELLQVERVGVRDDF